MKFQGKVGGFDDMHRLLKGLPVAVEKRVLQKSTLAATRQAVKPVVVAATPRGDEPSAASKKYGRGYKNIKVARLRRTRKGTKGARIDTGMAFWLWFQEKGTRNIPARPFFAPAVRAAFTAWVAALAVEMRKNLTVEIEKFANRRMR